MALGPLSSLPAAPPQATPARDVTAAQRAFFRAALGEAAPMAAIETAEPRTAPAAEPAKPADPPKTTYRPGSLLDVRI